MAKTDAADQKGPPPTQRSVPRALAGWPEGMTYVPRPFVDIRALLNAECREYATEYVKQHRGRGKNGDDDG